MKPECTSKAFNRAHSCVDTPLANVQCWALAAAGRLVQLRKLRASGLGGSRAYSDCSADYNVSGVEPARQRQAQIVHIKPK
jgi:hypothetical protein